MESIHLHINRLGLIQNADIDLAPFMIFSGESGLGKSYLSILCHYFFEIWLSRKSLDNFLKDKIIALPPNEPPAREPQTLFAISKADLEQWLAQAAVAYLKYMLGYDDLDAELQVTLPQSIPPSIDFKYLILPNEINHSPVTLYIISVLDFRFQFSKDGLSDFDNPGNDLGESCYSFCLRFGIIGKLFGGFRSFTDSFVFPPARGCYLSESITPLTGLMQRYIEGMHNLEKAQEHPEQTSPALLKLFRSVLEGNVVREGKQYVYITQAGYKMPIPAAAASVREAGPLQMMITKKDISKIAVLVEEPEAHLHPLKQRQMADILSIMAMNGACLQITTHSDYFLHRINDLIRLYIIRERAPENFEAFCKKHEFNPQLTLNPALLSAYFLQRHADGNSVEVIHQDSRTGIPFDTFTVINGKYLDDSALLYDIAINNYNEE